MTETKSTNGFLFHVISDTGNGHQIQTTFNLPVGATAKDMGAVFDEYFAAIKRVEARVRLPAIEAQYLQASAKLQGIKKAVSRLEDAPQLNGKRRTQDEAQYQGHLAQLDAEEAMLSLHKRSLELTAKEAEQESPCLTQAVNS
jgi:hypothetical protein